MTNPRDERLEAVLREMEQQDLAWLQAWALLARLGEIELAVPGDVLSQIAGPTREPAAPVPGVRA